MATLWECKDDSKVYDRMTKRFRKVSRSMASVSSVELEKFAGLKGKRAAKARKELARREVNLVG